jgi:hypothetical protein
VNSKNIYLDVCALCRPFDDQSFVRIRIESDAVKLILQGIKAGLFQLLLSPVHYREISAFSDVIERVELLGVINSLGTQIKTDPIAVRQRTEYLLQLGFGVADAAHVVFAEGNSASFISCDDKLLKKCVKMGISIWCGDPLQFCFKENVK